MRGKQNKLTCYMNLIYENVRKLYLHTIHPLMNSIAASDSSRTKKVIFVVDDDESVLFLVNYWFVRNRFLPITFSDTQNMIETLKTVRPDLILLDVRLSNEDGRSVCQHLKEERKLSVPIVLFSSYLQYSEKVDQWSASGFIEKSSDYYKIAKALEPFLFSEPN